MKKRFDFLMVILTVAAALPAFLLANQVTDTFAKGTVISAVVVNVLFFAVLMAVGFLAMQIALLISKKKYNLQTSGAFVRFLVVLVITAIIMAVGQFLYCIEWQTYSTEKVIDNNTKGNHLVILMDVSGSMSDEREACVNAACELVDSLDDKTSLQFIAFSGTVDHRCTTSFLPLTPNNKTIIKNVIQNVNMTGGTNFNYPLEEAIDTLLQNQDPDYRSMILMLTDGENATVSNENKKKLRDTSNNLELFTLRVTAPNAAMTPEQQELVALSVQDFPLEQQADGTLDMSTVLKTFQTAINHKKVEIEWHKKLGMGGDLLISDQNRGFWWRPVLQIAAFTAFSVLLSVAYYGKPGVLSLILSIAAGALTGWLAGINADLATYTLWFLCLPAFTVYEIGEGS